MADAISELREEFQEALELGHDPFFGAAIEYRAAWCFPLDEWAPPTRRLLWQATVGIMKRSEILELYYIAPFENLASILHHGVLSHDRAERHNPTSVANPDVQNRRKGKSVLGRKPLHEYVNLYVNARNAMLFAVLGFPNKPPSQHLSICVLSVHPVVLDLPGVVITDRNAAADFWRCYPSPAGLEQLDQALIFSRAWKDEDEIEEMRKREGMMAEVLVPDRIDTRFVQRAYVCCSAAEQRAQAMGLGIAFAINRPLFFNDWGRHHA